MATKKIYIGSFGPFLYDDTDTIDDADGDFSGETQQAMVSDGSVRVEGDFVITGDLSIEGGATFSGNVSVAEGASFTCDNVTTRISQGVTGLTVSDHPTFDYITLTTQQGVTGLGVGDHPTFDYIVLSTQQGVTGLGTGDHPTFDYVNLSTSQGVTGLTVSDSPTFNNMTLTGTFNGRQVNPDNDNTYDVGESGRRWKKGYFVDLSFGTYAAITTETLQGFITITDTAGNSRKVAVVA